MTRKTFKKKIVTDETMEKVNPENKKLANRFLKHKSLTTSPLTVKNYSSDLDIVFSYLVLEKENEFFIDLKKFDIIEMFSFFANELKWGSARQNRCRSTLSSLSIFVERVLDDLHPDFKGIVLSAIESVPNSPRRDKTILSDEQVESLLKHLSEKNKNQEACWLALAVASGARFKEILRFSIPILDNAKDAFEGVFLETEPIKVKGRGVDGRKKEQYIMKDVFLPYYSVWKEEREKILLEKNLEHDSLFIRKNGAPATDGTVRSWIRSMGKFLGEDLYAHSLRHFLVTKLTLKGIPQELIIALLGWKSGGAMFDIYNDSSASAKEWKELKNLK